MLANLHPSARLLGVVTLAGIGTLGYSLWEARQYTLRRIDLHLARPSATGRADPLQVLHLSDLHLFPGGTGRIDWVRGLGALEPDLTVVTGDFCGDADGPRLALQALEPLLRRPGVYVHGSNDYFGPTFGNPVKYLTGPSSVGSRRPPIDLTALTEGLATAGWQDLDNARGFVEVAGWTIDARGVDDPHIGRDRYAEVAGPYRSSAGLRLGVTHAPYRRVLDRFAGDGADLILAGHTHGGQVCLPGVGSLVTNCDLPRAQARGLSSWGEAELHVSAGLGTNPYTPIRFACRPEATLLTIHG